MDERFPDEFVTWNHNTCPGIKVSEVFGMDSKSGKVWMELARQIYCEQGPEYREIAHFENGAPYLEGYPGRISLTHTNHLFAVASLPKTPEVELAKFSPRSAMGIDAESLDRAQVLKVRDKFLSDEEKKLVSAKNLLDNITAWTAKEALYKAALTEGLDFKNAIKIKKLPIVESNPLDGSLENLGEAIVILPEEGESLFKLYSYESYGCCLTIAYSYKCAKFSKGN